MRRFVCITLCCLSLLFASTSPAQAPANTAVPNLVRYGGVLKDAQGTPLASTTAGVIFSIYKQQEGGAPVWMETQTVTTDASGNYSVVLGSTTATGLPADLFSQQEQRWLGVELQGQPEQSRVLLVSVPYAFHAGEAEKLAGHSASEFVTTNNLQIAVQQQLQQTGTANGATSKTTESSSGNTLVPTMGATDFIDNTTDQVVLVQQNGTGVGLSASSPSNVGVLGTVNSTAKSGIVAGVEGTSTATGGYGLFGYSTANSGGIGLQGRSDSPDGIGMIGWAIGSSAIAIDATSTATTGSPIGLVARVYSPSATAAYIQTRATGTITGPLINALVGNGSVFQVDAGGDVIAGGKFMGNGSSLTGLTFGQIGGYLGSTQLNGLYSRAVSFSNTSNSFTGSGAGLTGVPFSQLSGTLTGSQLMGTYSLPVILSNTNNSFTGSFTGSGAGLTGIQFSQLSGQLGSGQLSGTYSSAVTLSNTGNAFAGSFTGSFSGNGSGLTGVAPASGSPFYIQNGTSQQTGASFNIDGSGTAGGTLAGNAVNTVTNYQLGGSSLLSANSTSSNLALGFNSGPTSSGSDNTFLGINAGTAITSGNNNVFVGIGAGSADTAASGNTFIGANAGATNNGAGNIFIGSGVGNSSGASDIYIGVSGPASESSTLRIGASGLAGAYIGGIYGASPSGALPVVINASGQLGTTSTVGVTSWNGRTGAVVPQSGDYSFPMISGTLSSSQVPAGSPDYIQNGTAQQTGANFNIDGNGTVGGTLSGNAVNTATNYTLSGTAVLSASSSNLFVGEFAGQASPSGTANTFLGQNAGQATTMGTSNTFVGDISGSGNQTGSNNTFLGYATGNQNQSNSDDTFVGAGAGAHSTADDNTFLGFQAGFQTTMGSNNVFLGWQAGSNNMTGSNNIYITSQALLPAPSPIRFASVRAIRPLPTFPVSTPPRLT